MKVSVLMSCFNPNPQFLRTSVTSVLEQTLTDFEFIIMDDCSKTPITTILSALGISDPRIHVYRSSVQLGLARQLNAGLTHCSGDYIARMDDDDVMLPNRLERQASFIQRASADGCWSAYTRIDQLGNPTQTVVASIPPQHLLRTLVARGNPLCHSSLFVRTESIRAIGGYDDRMIYAQDADLNIRLVNRCRMLYLPETLQQFRTNISRNDISKSALSDCLSLFAAYKYTLAHPTLRARLWLLCRTLLFTKQAFVRSRGAA